MGRRLGKQKYVAIDYDRREVRLVVFEYVRKALEILSAHAVAVPENVNVADARAMGELLRGIVGDYHLRGAGAVMCVGRSQVILKSLQLPANSSTDELASMVQFQASRELPFAAEEAVVDFTRAEHFDAAESGAAEAGAGVLAAAVRLAVVQDARQICEDAGLRLERLALRPYANLRAAYHCVRFAPGERVLLVDLTADEVEIDVMRDEMLEFSRSATIAPSDPKVPEDKRETIARAVMEVARSLQSFLAMQRGGGVSACLVAGATGMEREFTEALAGRLGVRCEQFDPSAGFGVRLERASSSFSAALGLTVGDGAEAMPLDFLNPKRPAEPKDTRRTKVLVAAVAIVAVFGAVAVTGSHYLGKKDAVIDQLDTAKEKLTARNKALTQVQKRVAAIEEWQGADVAWLDQLVHLSNTLPGAETLYLARLQCKTRNIVSLSGFTKSGQELMAFAEEQNQRPGYKVRPKGTTPKDDRYGYNEQFDLEFAVEDGAVPVLKADRPIARPTDDDPGGSAVGRGGNGGRAPAGQTPGSSRRTSRRRP